MVMPPIPTSFPELREKSEFELEAYLKNDYTFQVYIYLYFVYYYLIMCTLDNILCFVYTTPSYAL